MKKLKPLMFVGTGSDVGKSIINTAFCRILLQDGYRPAPFKAQNMSLNSYATPDGLEIGRAQAVQAEACGLECIVDMNPVLLKPTGNMQSQVVLNGKPIGNQTAKEYFLSDNKAHLFEEVMQAYSRLEKKFNPIVLEGAGSISELNLKARDITNMRMAKEVNAVTYLVADIDRGGVFASVFGSIALLPEDEKKLIKGIIINKFRGDIDLFSEGRSILEKITGVPVIGVIPQFNHITIEEEDSVGLMTKNKKAVDGKINVCIIHLKYLSNFTDFNRFTELDDLNIYFTSEVEQLKKADIIILPGSKNTVSDMQYLNESGLANQLITCFNTGKAIYGICGGYQLMGEKIIDPFHVESDIESINGLGILPVTTTLTAEKNSSQCNFNFLDSKEKCMGYEIHMGQTKSIGNSSPLATLANGLSDGYFLNNRVWGSYIHGIFDNTAVLNSILRPFLKAEVVINNYHEFKEREYDKLADFIRENVDVQAIYKQLGL
jgi:adenosylcobyric acid synthase